MAINKINKIPRKDYEELKRVYLTKSKSMHSLYVEFNKKNLINKKIFFDLINMIRFEEGYPEFVPAKKTKRAHNKFSYHDKHPNSYKTGRDFLN